MKFDISVSEKTQLNRHRFEFLLKEKRPEKLLMQFGKNSYLFFFYSK